MEKIKPPVNTIFLDEQDTENIDELVDSYYDILKTCRNPAERKAVLKMVVEESFERNTRIIFLRLVQHLAEMQENKK